MAERSDITTTRNLTSKKRAEEDEVVDLSSIQKEEPKKSVFEGNDPDPEEQTGYEGENAPARAKKPEPQTLQKSTIRVRARQTRDYVTYGQGRHFSLEEGRRYDLPPDAADRLAERGIVEVL